MKNIPYLDGWRGIAILLVLVDHFGPAKYWYLGRLGVVMFFVLSGMFMGRILFVKKAPLTSFFARRFARIIPALWIYVAAMWIYSTYFQQTPYDIGMGEVGSVISFLSTYTTSLWEAKWPIGQLWSLNVEEHSYVLLAIVAVAAAKTKGKITVSTLLAAILAVICAVTVLYMSEVLVVKGSPWRIRTEVACLGIITSAAVCVWRENSRMSWIKGWPIPMAALAIGLLSFRPRGAIEWNFSILVAPILMAIAINFASSFPEVVKKLLTLQPLRWLGTCSFSIYLWQGPFYSATLASGASKPLCLVGSILVGATSFYLIENPARLYLNRKLDALFNARVAVTSIPTETA